MDNNENEIFVTKTKLSDLEVKTSDNVVLYVSGWWLSNLSPYFDKCINVDQNLVSNLINLPYRASILVLLFKCALRGYLGDTHIKNTYINKLNNANDMYEFLTACNEFQLNKIQSLCEDGFSTENELAALFSNQLITIIRTFKMERLKQILLNLLDKRPDLFDKLDYKTLDGYDMEFITNHWSQFIKIFGMWSEVHDPTDEELKKYGTWENHYEKLPNSYIGPIVKILRKLHRADGFKFMVYEKLNFC